MAKENKFVCTDCFKLKRCKESFVSWIFFFTAIVAVISIRIVNVFMNTNPTLAKAFWYTGVIGFLIFFVYKFRYDNIVRRELESCRLKDKLILKKELSEHDYEVLGTIICKLLSKKDAVNYFCIFFFSGLALALAIYFDFFR